MGATAVIPVLATVLSAKAQKERGRAEDKRAQFEAEQLEERARQQRAASQRKASDARRRTRFAESRALALAAAGGAGASDPTVANLIAGIAGEGEFAAQSVLYEGEERARGDILQARATRYEGAQARRAGYLRAGTTLLTGLSGIKYG
jgi:hypothetical protein